MPESLTPDLLIRAYAAGCFPMAESRDSADVSWYSPDPRAILPLDAVHVPRKIAKLYRQRRYELTINEAFDAVMEACARPRRESQESWINPAIMTSYSQLHREGFAMSVEAWADEDDVELLSREGPSGGTDVFVKDGKVLAGGIYAVSLGAAIFAESMFSRLRDASSLCLIHLVELCKKAGITLLDVQLTNPHIERFGVIEIPRDQFIAMLGKALHVEPATSESSTHD